MIDVPTRVKDALREGDRLKRYRFVVDSDPVITITNDNLVSESVTFDERMCSDKEIKFGLCEGTNLEFQYFGLPNITGKRLQAFIDVQYKDSDGVLKWYEIPMGWFEVSESSRQASTGIIKVSAFNKLQSNYLDNKANDAINTLSEIGDVGTEGEISIQSLLDALLDGYYIETEPNVIYNTNVLGTSQSYNAFGLTIVEKVGSSYVSTGKYVGTFDLAHHLTLDSGQPYDSNKYYRFVIKSKALSDYVKTYIDPYIYDEHGEPLLFYNQRLNAGETAPWGWKYKTWLSSYAPTDLTVYDNNNNPVYYYFYYDEDVEEFTTPWITNLKNTREAVYLSAPLYLVDEFPVSIPDSVKRILETRYAEMWDAISNIVIIEERVLTDIENMRFTNEDTQTWSDITIRDLQTAVFEMNCQYGKLDRTTDLFSGVELNNSRLLPAEGLYPANDLYPASQAERSNPAMYSKLWADEGNVRKFRYLIITYKSTETEGGQTREVEKTLQRTVDENGTDDYNMSDNWLFKNLVWTDEEVGDYADAMVAKMQNLTWFPFEMWCAGLPYVETGDELEINVNGEAYTSYVLRRNLRGIQNLQDEMINGELDIF